MANAVTCDCCGQVIPDDQHRLVVRVGNGKGTSTWGCTDEDELDFCETCRTERPVDVMQTIGRHLLDCRRDARRIQEGISAGTVKV